MKALLTWVGLIPRAPFENQKTIIKIAKSTYPDDRPTEQDWINEFRVSIMYGKIAVHF
jgi:hypothetical protein